MTPTSFRFRDMVVSEHADWVQVPESELQRWLDTAAPDYTLEHQWGDDLMVCHLRHSRVPFAYQENKAPRRCFVHRAYLPFSATTGDQPE